MLASTAVASSVAGACGSSSELSSVHVFNDSDNIRGKGPEPESEVACVSNFVACKCLA